MASLEEGIDRGRPNDVHRHSGGDSDRDRRSHHPWSNRRNLPFLGCERAAEEVGSRGVPAIRPRRQVINGRLCSLAWATGIGIVAQNRPELAEIAGDQMAEDRLNFPAEVTPNLHWQAA